MHKLAEVRAMLAETGVELRSQSIEVPELQGTMEEISRDKCRRAAEAVGSQDPLRWGVGGEHFCRKSEGADSEACLCRLVEQCW